MQELATGRRAQRYAQKAASKGSCWCRGQCAEAGKWQLAVVRADVTACHQPSYHLPSPHSPSIRIFKPPNPPSSPILSPFLSPNPKNPNSAIMVGTRPKNQLGKIPTGTKIDLTASPPKKSPQAKRKIMTSPSDNPKATAEPSSPTKATSVEVDATIDALAPSPPLKAPAKKSSKKARAVKEKTPEPEAEAVASEAASSSDDHNVEEEETSDAKAKPAAEEEEIPAAEEEEVPAGDVEILEEEAPEEEEAHEEEQQEEEEFEEEKGSEGTTAEKQSSSDIPVPKKRTRSESRLAIVASAPKRRALASADKPPRSSPSPSLREVVKSKVYDWELLETLGVAKAVRGYFKAIGWEGFLTWKGTVYPTLAREFIQSLNAKSPARIRLTTDCISFRLCDQEFSLSINDLNTSLGITAVHETKTDAYKTAFTTVPEQSGADWDSKWQEVGLGDTFTSGYTKGNELKDGALRMCHRLIAYSFYGKVDSSNSISQQELFILWCMVNGLKVNFAAFAIAHFRDIVARSKQRISLGHLVTVLAKYLKVLDEDDHVLEVIEESYIDKEMLSRASDLEMKKGVLYLTAPTTVSRSASPAPRSARKKGVVIKEENDDVTARLARIEEQQKATHAALMAYFDYAGFRYPAASQ